MLSRLLVPLLLDASSLADTIAQVVELGSPHITATYHLDGMNDGRMEREDALDSDAKAELADCERSSGAATVAGDNNTLKDLNALAAAFDDAHVNTHGVAGPKVRYVVAQVCGLDLIDRIHGVLREREKRIRGREFTRGLQIPLTIIVGILRTAVRQLHHFAVRQ